MSRTPTACKSISYYCCKRNVPTPDPCMAEKIWEHFSLFVNFENFTDTRQTRFDSIYTGTATYPAFRDIYAPLDGFVVNGGLKLKL
ncbi:MAG TPA: hypothetical protein VGN00_22590 [Puia sp.]